MQSKGCLPLKQAEHNLLQVLINQFHLRRSGDGVVLNVRFSYETPAIWRREAKPKVKTERQSREAEDIQAKLDAFLHGGGKGQLAIKTERLLFRFGNGGTLPIIRRGEKEYYCLFLRDIDPRGWNIANGGCDTLDELLHPIQTIERELAEELLVVDPATASGYVFVDGGGRQLQRPDSRSITRLWNREAPGVFEGLSPCSLVVSWIDGHDVLEVQMDDNPVQRTTGCFVNINASDLGVEVDKIVQLVVPPSALLCDGEINDGVLLNRPIGLFDVERMHTLVDSDPESTSYEPDLLFFSASSFGGGELENVAVAFDEYLHKHFPGRRTQARSMAENRHFPLCPVTRSLLRRTCNLEARIVESASAGEQ